MFAVVHDGCGVAMSSVRLSSLQHVCLSSPPPLVSTQEKRSIFDQIYDADKQKKAQQDLTQRLKAELQQLDIDKGRASEITVDDIDRKIKARACQERESTPRAHALPERDPSASPSKRVRAPNALHVRASSARRPQARADAHAGGVCDGWR
eukprot:91049-Pleurochrysis_carterae.AAC.1